MKEVRACQTCAQRATWCHSCIDDEIAEASKASYVLVGLADDLVRQLLYIKIGNFEPAKSRNFFYE